MPHRALSLIELMPPCRPNRTWRLWSCWGCGCLTGCPRLTCMALRCACGHKCIECLICRDLCCGFCCSCPCFCAVCFAGSCCMSRAGDGVVVGAAASAAAAPAPRRASRSYQCDGAVNLFSGREQACGSCRSEAACVRQACERLVAAANGAHQPVVLWMRARHAPGHVRQTASLRKLGQRALEPRQSSGANRDDAMMR